MQIPTPEIERWQALIRDVPDFPQPGILFRDITPLLHDPAALCEVNDALAIAARAAEPTVVAGIEARGFLFGIAVAERLGLPFVPVRKPGKLPAPAAIVEYELEYGTDSLEMHDDPPVRGQRVIVIDDLLATGGTAAATGALIRAQGGVVAGYTFLIELSALSGRSRLAEHPETPVTALLHY